METQHTAYCQFRSVFGIVSIPNTDFGNYNFQRYSTHIHICKQNPQKNGGFYLQFANSIYMLRFPLIVAESATAQFNYTIILLFVCGFRKLFWIPQVRLRIPQNCLFSERFWAVQCFRYCLWNPKQRIRSKKSKVADSATNLILACCGIRLQCTECTVSPRNVEKLFSCFYFCFLHNLFFLFLKLWWVFKTSGQPTFLIPSLFPIPYHNMPLLGKTPHHVGAGCERNAWPIWDLSSTSLPAPPPPRGSL